MSPRLRAMIAMATLTVGLILTGCSGSSSGLDTQTSESWQARVVAIADHAAAGDPTAALLELAVLEAEAAQALESGEVSAERAETIRESIALVREDLEASSVDTPVPEPEETGGTIDPNVDESDNGNDGNNGNGNNGNGNGNDGNNGNGNGNG